MNKYYAGVGSRETPSDIQALMTATASQLEKSGWLLSSGGADGADKAFEAGVLNPQNKRIYIPNQGFNNNSTRKPGVYSFDDCPVDVKQYCRNIVSTIHPAPDRLSDYAWKLHSRNVLQVMGDDLNTWVKFVLYYASEDKHGNPMGGTRTAVMLARSLNIPTFNMLHEETIERLNKMIERNKNV